MDVNLIHFNRPETALLCSELWLTAGAERVVIWDNASRPDAINFLARAVATRGRFVLQRLPENRGFAGGAAAAVGAYKSTPGDSALIVAAHDAAPEPDLLHDLESIRSADPSIGLLFPSDGRGVIGAWHPLRGLRTLPLGSPPIDRVDCLFAPAAAFLLTRAAADAGVCPDEKLFCYGEECDLGLQARALGFRAAAAALAVVHNTEDAASVLVPTSVAFLLARNSIYLARKHSTWPCYLLQAAWVVVQSAAHLAYRRPTHSSLDPVARLRGALAAITNRMGPPPMPNPTRAR